MRVAIRAKENGQTMKLRTRHDSRNIQGKIEKERDESGEERESRDTDQPPSFFYNRRSIDEARKEE